MLVFVYDEMGSPIAMKYRDSSYAKDTYDIFLYEKNLQGDIIAIYNSSGTKIGTYDYDAWGAPTATTDLGPLFERSIVTTYNPFRYRGYYYDTETSLYYLQSRYYDPDLGRFINADGLIGTGGFVGYNMFAYCNNNPVMNVDPAGNLHYREAGGGFYGYSGYGGTGSIRPEQVFDTAVVVATIAAGFTTIDEQQEKFALKQRARAEAKEKAIAVSSKTEGITYYHVTTPENAVAIMSTNTMIGSNWEGGYVYAWRTYPDQYAIENSGAHMGVIISFKTNATFVMDPGITDPAVQQYGPVVSAMPGPIAVWDVKIVG